LIAEMLVSLKAQGEKKFSVREILFFGEEAAEYDISIVIPMRNESNRIKPFLQDLNEELLILQKTCEVIFIDNGSDDDTFDNLKAYAFSDMVHLKIIRLRKAYALSSAIQAGFQFVNGNYIITMTAGQRNIVTSISRLTDCLQDNQIARGYRIGFPSFIGSILSVVFNKTISFLSGVQVNDLNCNMYAFRKEILETIRSYGDRQRFYPLVAAKQGCRLVEVPMNYEDFRPGSLKKKFKRIPADILDILTVILLTDFKARPLHLFGLIGIVCGLIGLSINLYLTILKFWTGTTGGHYTLLLMGVTLMILGLQWFTTGLLGEVINSVYQKAKLP
jgi:glycosyltransferase involved in cell wall biosynthesis